MNGIIFYVKENLNPLELANMKDDSRAQPTVKYIWIDLKINK